MLLNLSRKHSILGASLAITSFLISLFPAKGINIKQKNSLNNGTLRMNSGGDNYVFPVISCCLGGTNNKCHMTEFSGSTGLGFWGTLIMDEDGIIYDTNGNTSISFADIQIDTTSYLVQIN